LFTEYPGADKQNAEVLKNIVFDQNKEKRTNDDVRISRSNCTDGSVVQHFLPADEIGHFRQLSIKCRKIKREGSFNLGVEFLVGRF
jgi:hypothetical protein